ncbi:MAG: Mur ligase domain-containing protein [Ferruginibacter sp.]
MISSLHEFNKVFFIGIAGTGMSALAQYLAGKGKQVSGSDRYFTVGEISDTRQKLEEAGIKCYLQNGSGLSESMELVVVSAAIEETVYEVQKAKALGLPILKRSELLGYIARSNRTIAVAGTSGKSTTSAMLFDIMQYANLQPSIISGAGLISIIKKNRIGNTFVGGGEWLIIEADESDGSIVEYAPEIGLLLNVDKDHQEMEELIKIFTIFKHNTTRLFVVNRDNPFAKALSQNNAQDFSTDAVDEAGYQAINFVQNVLEIQFDVVQMGKDTATHFTLQTVGRHNMENALAAIAVAHQIGVAMQTCAEALKNYEGIYRRHQLLGNHKGINVIDDYAHNPVKCAASIKACHQIAPKVIAWFQPHGYGPTRFLKNDFIKEISGSLRDTDEIWMSEIFYAGGTAEKNISANELIQGIKQAGKQAYFVEDRKNFLATVKIHLTGNCVLLLMGARDPGLEDFSKGIWQQIQMF